MRMLPSPISGAVQRGEDMEGDAPLAEQLPEHELCRFGGAVGVFALGGPAGVREKIRRAALWRLVVAEDVDRLEDVIRQTRRRDRVGIGDALFVVVNEGQHRPDRPARSAKEAVSGEVTSYGGQSQTQVGDFPVDRRGAEVLLAALDQLVDAGVGAAAGSFPSASGQPSRSQKMNW